MREVPQQVELAFKDARALIDLSIIWSERNCSTFISGARLVLSATIFIMGVAGLSLWAAIVAVLDVIAARERKRLPLPRQDG